MILEIYCYATILMFLFVGTLDIFFLTELNQLNVTFHKNLICYFFIAIGWLPFLISGLLIIAWGFLLEELP